MSRLRQWIFANVRLLRWILINLGVGLAPFLLNLFFWAHGSSSDVWKFVSNSPDIWFITVTLCLTTLADLIDSALTKRIPHDMTQMALLTGCAIAVVMLIASGFYFMKTEQGIKLSKSEEVENIRSPGWVSPREIDKKRNPRIT